MTELLTNQRKQGMAEGLTGMAITTVIIALTIMDVLTLAEPNGMKQVLNGDQKALEGDNVD
jgi:hypothetical protein